MEPIRAERRTEVGAGLDDLIRFHEQQAAFERLSPPWRKVRILERSGGIAPGARTVFKGRFGPVPFTWVAEHIEHEGPGFTDVMRKGPFASWRHEHLFEARGSSAMLIDRIEATLPIHALTPGFLREQIRVDIEAMLRYRHRVTIDDLEDPLPAGALRIGITGSSGLIGRRLKARLRARGHSIRELVRGEPREGQARWEPQGSTDPSSLEGLDAVVHLAGESIGARVRWTASARERIMGSRRDGTASIARAVAQLPDPKPVLISASAVGFYGDRRDPIDEDAAPGEGFLAEVCQAWESAADPARDAGVRVVHPRIGIVISADSPAVIPMRLAASAGLLGPIGSGKQPFPWITLHDLTRGLEHLIGSDLSGPVNMSIPDPPTQRDFARELASALSRPSFLRVPSVAVTAALGDQGRELLLFGQRLISSRLMRDGFEPSLPDLKQALRLELGI